MIGTILITLVIGGPLGILLWRQLTRLRASGGGIPSVALLLATLAGTCLGLLLNSLTIPIGTHFRVAGIPLPGVLFHLEDGEWIDFVVSAPYVNWIVNVGLFGLVGAVGVALALGRRKTPQNQAAQVTAPKVADPGR